MTFLNLNVRESRRSKQARLGIDRAMRQLREVSDDVAEEFSTEATVVMTVRVRFPSDLDEILKHLAHMEMSGGACLRDTDYEWTASEVEDRCNKGTFYVDSVTEKARGAL